MYIYLTNNIMGLQVVGLPIGYHVITDRQSPSLKNFKNHIYPINSYEDREVVKILWWFGFFTQLFLVIRLYEGYSVWIDK